MHALFFPQKNIPKGSLNTLLLLVLLVLNPLKAARRRKGRVFKWALRCQLAHLNQAVIARGEKGSQLPCH
jgi:hypothetical protein